MLTSASKFSSKVQRLLFREQDFVDHEVLAIGFCKEINETFWCSKWLCMYRSIASNMCPIATFKKMVFGRVPGDGGGHQGTPGDTEGHWGTRVPARAGTCKDLRGHAGTCVPAVRGHGGTCGDTRGHVSQQCGDMRGHQDTTGDIGGQRRTREDTRGHGGTHPGKPDVDWDPKRISNKGMYIYIYLNIYIYKSIYIHFCKLNVPSQVK